MIFPEIVALCKQWEQEFDQITIARKVKLHRLAKYIDEKRQAGLVANITVICTHNSRRSHFGQLSLALAADYYQLADIHTYSGGTEATAFNPRAVAVLQALGFQISTTEAASDNPIYAVKWKNEMSPYQAFSKKYETAPNPQKGFGAVMVCTEADKGCPVVLGCDFRLALPFEDPKVYDNTELEAIKYKERFLQMGREMCFVLNHVRQVRASL
ncbi:MAG: protein-tyrosine-phosphatase [Chitinophagales bacterium]